MLGPCSKGRAGDPLGSLGCMDLTCGWECEGSAAGERHAGIECAPATGCLGCFATIRGIRAQWQEAARATWSSTQTSQGLETGLGTLCRNIGDVVRGLSSMGRLPLKLQLCAACWGSDGPALQRTMDCLACQSGTKVLVQVPAASLSSP